jgi:hypothetical protein
MANFQEIIGRIAGIISLVGFVPYILTILQGKTRPNRVTWWIWTVIGGMLCASYYSAGARYTLWVPISYVIGPLTIAVLSIKYGEGGWNKFDRLCLYGASVSLVLWWLLGSPLIALMINILIDLFGALPTIRKSYYEPETEDRLSWSLFLTGNSINLSAIQNWSLATSIYPLYLLSISAIIMTLINYRRVDYDQVA